MAGDSLIDDWSASKALFLGVHTICIVSSLVYRSRCGRAEPGGSIRRSLVKEQLGKGTPSSEVTELCTLLARILYRGLVEQDPRALALLSSSAVSPTPPKEKGTSDHAA